MKRISAALLFVLLLGGCAVTGQPAPPGTVAVYDGNTVTHDEVAAWSTALNELGFPDAPGEVVTLLLLEPIVTQAAANDGKVMTDDEVAQAARFWALAADTTLTQTTDEQLAVVRTVLALATQAVQADPTSLTFTQPVLDALAEMEASAQISPRYGAFSQATFMDSVAVAFANAAAYTSAEGQVSYLVLKDVSGFTPDAQRAWMGDEASPSRPAA